MPPINAPASQPANTGAAPFDPVAALQAMQAAGGQPAEEQPKVRPEIPQHVKAQIDQWFRDTDNLVQRGNALWEYREANKTLFPARFNPNDPRRGQVPHELRNGRDNRRVQTPRIFRDSIQSTAMSVPEDLTFKWSERQQVTPPEGAIPPAAVGGIPPAMNANDMSKKFAETLDIVERNMLEEADWIAKVQAFVQDGSVYPMAILKHVFRRDYATAPISGTPMSQDSTDQMSRLEALMRQFAGKEFDQNSPHYARMLDLVKALQSKASVSRVYQVVISLVPMDAFGVSEEAIDLVDIYDAPWMFQDTLMVGEEILARFPYKVGEDGVTYGILPAELNEAVPWDSTGSTSTDPNARNRASRNRQLTAPRATSINAVATNTGTTTDPKKRKYVVREIWCKRERRVYTVIRGIKHYLECVIPEKTSERWYPFTIYVPNRVPTEIYGASDLELKRDIQARWHRKRTDEEKARFLSIKRFVYNTALVDSKEIVKLSDIPPGQARGINFGNGMKPSEAIFPIEMEFNPASYDTTADERDMDMMGALPVQALGTTGQANFAAEVSTATQGAAVATQHRQNLIRRAIDGMLTCIAEVLVQELTLDEVQRIAGPFAVWPEIYSDQEAASIVEEAKQRAMQAVSPTVLAAAVQDLQAGIPIDPPAIQRALESQAAVVWQQEMVMKYGNIEPMSRESLFRRLKIKVKSSLLSSLDRQQRIQQLAMLANGVLSLAQAAQATGQIFNPRPLFKNFAMLADDDDTIDEMFPGVSSMEQGAAMAAQAAQGAAGMELPGGGGQPEDQGAKGQEAEETRQPADEQQQQSPGTPTPDKLAMG